MIDWDEEYALLITVTGWTYEYIDEWVTLPRLNALKRHWLNSPPVHITVARFVGIKPVSKPQAFRKLETAWQGATVLNEDQWRGLAAGSQGAVRKDIRRWPTPSK